MANENTNQSTSNKRIMPKWEMDGRDRLKAAIRKYGRSLADLKARDANEADTRLFVTDFLCDAFGFDKYTDLSAFAVDLLGETTPSHKVDLLFYLTREALKKGKIGELWQAKRATAPNSLATVLLSDPVLHVIRRELRKTTGYNVDLSEISRLVKDTCLRNECFDR